MRRDKTGYIKVSNIELRNTTENDLETLFVFQLDKDANYLAAFTSKDPTNKIEYMVKWTRLLADSTVIMRTILVNNEIAGSVVKYEMEGKAEITYWIDKNFWGMGVATKTLEEFLKTENIRPIYGRVAFDNFGSQRVLEKCGFEKIGTEKGFANARDKEIEEFIYKLE
jgi:RimJ/RimL family protein N-acetyltransferase